MQTNYTTPKKLLSPGATNSKTAKNEIKTFILYLSPYNLNSKKINLCPHASKGCAAACLYSAGRGAFSNVQKARQNKTEYFLHSKKEFIQQLAGEIIKETNKARKAKTKLAFRLNGTSDIDFVYLLNKYAGLDISSLKDTAVFYDYTKIFTKANRYKNHPNYVLTFSRSEENNTLALSALRQGINVAAVFSGDLPNNWEGFEVVDGDRSDLVMLSHKGKVLGLKAKGKARKDNSGFVLPGAIVNSVNSKVLAI